MFWVPVAETDPPGCLDVSTLKHRGQSPHTLDGNGDGQGVPLLTPKGGVSWKCGRPPEGDGAGVGRASPESLLAVGVAVAAT